MHELDLIKTLAGALACALVLGVITHKLGLSPILGYLLAGIVIGPFTPGFVADAKVAAQFAEIGVILLMFGVGLHFHPRELLAVWKIAIPGAVGQSLLATGLGLVLGLAFGWSVSAGLVFGLALSVASTVVLMRVLSDNNKLSTPEGHIAVGWLVVEDIFTVLVLVLLPASVVSFEAGGSGSGGVLTALGLALLKLALLALVTFIMGARLIPWLLMQVARTRASELFTLAVLATALVIATGSAMIFGASVALGAFLAGMVVGQSTVSHQAAANALPMRDAFAVLFFVSVGMLFDPRLLIQEPLLVIGALGIILVGKPLAALAITIALRRTIRTGLTVAVGLAQIGEFSFILAVLARDLNVLPAQGHSVLVAAALLSITLNPLLFRLVEPMEAWLRRHKRVWAVLQGRAEARARAAAPDIPVVPAGDDVRAVVVGYGPVGQTVTRILREFDVRPVVVDLNVDTVAKLIAEGQTAIYGDASRDEILHAAGIGHARFLLVTLPDALGSLPVIAAARDSNPDVKILVRARYLADRAMLSEVGATAVVVEEAEAAVALAEYLLREIGAPQERIDEETNKIREGLAVSRWRPLLGGSDPQSTPPPAPPS